MPAPPGATVCVLCGSKLVPSGLGRRHENGLLRCGGQSLCGVCDAPSLVACSQPGHDLVGHPGCMVQCTCCGQWLCPAHASDIDRLCISCHSGTHTTHQEVYA